MSNFYTCGHSLIPIKNKCGCAEKVLIYHFSLSPSATCTALIALEVLRPVKHYVLTYCVHEIKIALLINLIIPKAFLNETFSVRH